LKLQGDCK